VYYSRTCNGKRLACHMESRDAKRLHCQLVPGPGADDIIWGVIEGSELIDETLNNRENTPPNKQHRSTTYTLQNGRQQPSTSPKPPKLTQSQSQTTNPKPPARPLRRPRNAHPRQLRLRLLHCLDLAHGMSHTQPSHFLNTHPNTTLSTALRRRLARDPIPLPAPRLGHPHPRHPVVARRRRGGQFPERGHGAEQS
jgi:hypothetical protein